MGLQHKLIQSESSIIKFDTTAHITSLVHYQAYQGRPTYPQVHPDSILRVYSAFDFYPFSNGVLPDSIYSLIFYLKSP